MSCPSKWLYCLLQELPKRSINSSVENTLRLFEFLILKSSAFCFHPSWTVASWCLPTNQVPSLKDPASVKLLNKFWPFLHDIWDTAEALWRWCSPLLWEVTKSAMSSQQVRLVIWGGQLWRATLELQIGREDIFSKRVISVKLLLSPQSLCVGIWGKYANAAALS